MKNRTTTLSLFLGLTLSSVMASAKVPTYTIKCGVSQGAVNADGRREYRKIADNSVQMNPRAGDGMIEGSISLAFKTAKGEPIELSGYAMIGGDDKVQMPSLFLTLKLPQDDKSVTISRSAVIHDSVVAGDILENGMTFNVGKEVPDFFQAGCGVQKSN